jgi:glutamate/tyrosine decarboxylase-like PLP-dependent enzyme
LHVDAAYGGPAILAADYRAALEDIRLADSVALDPHKWLYVPVEAGAVFVRDAALMRAAFSLVPPYLQTDGSPTGVAGLPWMSEYGFQQTRAFRALKVWMALKYFGLEGYRRAIEHDLAMARLLAKELVAIDGVQVWQPQNLSIVCFRYATDDQSNKKLLERVQLGGDAFLSGTTIDGRFWLRACVVNPRATERDIRTVVDVVRAAAKEEIHA